MIIDTPLESQRPGLRRLWKEAFADTDKFLDAFEKTAFCADRCRCVTVGSEVVSVLYWFDCLFQGAPVAYLYAVATAKAYRGRGFCHELMENTHQHLRQLGYEGAILVPGSGELFLLYKGIGYQACSTIREISCTASDEKVSLRRVGETEYASRRRELLPAGGIIQENENLHFLQTQAQFYTGEDFILAARIENEKLCGIELLGETSKASEIVGSLSCKSGTFRVPGTGKRFAMYRKLSASTLPAPSYFGLAFD